MTSNDDINPRQPDEDEPIEELLGDVLDLVDKTVSRITDAEVDEHLRKALSRSGYTEGLSSELWWSLQDDGGKHQNDNAQHDGQYAVNDERPAAPAAPDADAARSREPDSARTMPVRVTERGSLGLGQSVNFGSPENTATKASPQLGAYVSTIEAGEIGEAEDVEPSQAAILIMLVMPDDQTHDSDGS